MKPPKSSSGLGMAAVVSAGSTARHSSRQAVSNGSRRDGLVTIVVLCFIEERIVRNNNIWRGVLEAMSTREKEGGCVEIHGPGGKIRKISNSIHE